MVKTLHFEGGQLRLTEFASLSPEELGGDTRAGQKVLNAPNRRTPFLTGPPGNALPTYLDYLKHYAEHRLDCADVPPLFSSYDLFHPIASKFPVWFNPKSLQEPLGQLRREHLIHKVADGPSPRFKGNPGVGALYRRGERYARKVLLPEQVDRCGEE
jgi:hypothetical protein